MTQFPTVRVAAAQATPVVLDVDASVEKALGLIARAAEAGAQLLVLPECFLSVYPSGAWAADGAHFGGFDELWRRMWESAVDVDGPQVRRLVDACRHQGVHLAIGVNEREDGRPGSLYNTLLLIGPQGVLSRHRKTMPTMHERLFHGIGAGDDIDAVEIDGLGRVGGLICWENRMPLARWALMRSGVQVWVAPTADDSDGWLATVRHIAIESGAFVVSVPQYLPRDAFPAAFPVPIPDDLETLGRGGACIVEPTQGSIIAGPVYDQEALLVAECDLGRGLAAKRYFDAVGHYSRSDALEVPGH